MHKLGRYLVGIGLSQLVVACGDSSSGGATSAVDAMLVRTTAVEAGDDCAQGGLVVQQGVDADGDGELAEDEVESQQFICNGADGADGENGSDGVDGADGADGADGTDGKDGADGQVGEKGADGKDSLQLVVTVALDVGDENCPAGGAEIASGTDTDEDGELGLEEVASMRFVCNGAMSGGLVMNEVLDPGDPNCAEGGVAVSTGTDADGNGSLEALEVEATNYVCNGANGEALACTFPARLNDVLALCEVSADWAGADLSGRSLKSSYLAGIDLSGADLTGADLSWSMLDNANLAGATMVQAELADASFIGADLSNVDFSEADLANVDLSLATLAGATGGSLVACPSALPGGWSCWDLGAAGNTLMAPGADLTGLDLTSADLSSTPLAGVQAVGLAGCPAALPVGWTCIDLPTVGNTLVGPGADLSGLDLTGADFGADANLNSVDFRDTVLADAVFGTDTNLRNADLRDADLSGASFGDGTDLSDADLSGADLTDATFGQGVDLSDADLRSANFSGTDLSGVQLSGAVATGIAACPATMPTNFSCVSLGAVGNTFVGPGSDLSGLSLVGVDLSGQNLNGANLDNADLSNATLDGANLNNVDLRDTTLTGVSGIDLQQCPDNLPNGWDCVQGTLVGPSANLSGADLSGADLTNAELTSANLTGADLTDADLEGTNMDNATLTNIRATNLQQCPDGLPSGWDCVRRTLVGPSADLSDVDFNQADLSQTDMSGADLSGADLSQADLSDADLSNADLSNADLSEADLQGATVTGATFTGVTWDNTTCPDGSNSDDNGNTCL